MQNVVFPKNSDTDLVCLCCLNLSEYTVQLLMVEHLGFRKILQTILGMCLKMHTSVTASLSACRHSDLIIYKARATSEYFILFPLNTRLFQ